ncbi:hydroxyacylglutathione hydrolase [Solimonas sp. K1W22B-7]|uniref:FAD/NAD(P)-binding protein n=1 Tax=Solimonas sp. K1W22B-7 TaxID=2303331 RepID=UPI000E332003|nr:FAD/NAD(P)-binding protein [Solimonas sp. K1W22B-7]AXQ31187.1 hydroxyacylglutathione hydrolase [Solimonas sp. K1W22B-7]
MNPAGTTIAIIGAGFCGTALAVQLLRRPPVLPLKVVLINRSGLMARGVAYGTRVENHVLNVPAARMGVLPGEDEGFLQFAQRHDPRMTGGSFASRRLYGDYLETLLAEAAINAPAGCHFRAMVGDVERIRPEAGGGELWLSNGDRLQADQVVLALGHYAPSDPPVPEPQRGFYCSPRYVRDPWRPDALWGVKPGQPVLLVGSGLTMLDIVLDLRARGHQAPIHALSRRGLMPLAHRELEAAPVYDAALPQRMLAQPGARHYLRSLRAAVAAAEAQDGDWRDVIGALRGPTPELWRALPVAERLRFMRHLRPYWEVHRHRCAPELGRRLEAERASGGLQLIAGRVCGYDERPDGVGVLLRRRGASDVERLDVAAVINCSGPEADTRRSREPLLASLRSDGLAVPDELGLGLSIDPQNYALVDARGISSPWLRYVGPFLRARDWEATAVPELRQHVTRLAESLRSDLARPVEERLRYIL